MGKEAKALINGFIKAFDISGVTRPQVRVSNFIRQDEEAMRSDIRAVGESMREASKKFADRKKLRYGT